MKFSAYPTAQIKISALRTQSADSALVAAAAGLAALLFGTLLSLTSFDAGLLLRAVLFGNVVMCGVVALCYTATALRGKTPGGSPHAGDLP